MRAFKKDEDLEQINCWYLERGMSPLPLASIPRVGFIVDGIAAGFLFIADGGIALIEGFITNPTSMGAERKSALDAITEALLLEAKIAGVQRVLALTQSKSVEQRCHDYSFHQQGTFKLFAKEVN